MTYMQIATKHMSKSTGPLATDQTDPKAPKNVTNKLPTKKMAKVVKPSSLSKTLPAVSQPVAGTPFAALSGLMKK